MDIICFPIIYLYIVMLWIYFLFLIILCSVDDIIAIEYVVMIILTSNIPTLAYIDCIFKKHLSLVVQTTI